MIRGKCQYRKQLVDAASLVVHGDIEVQDPATRELAEGVVFLDLELEAARIDLQRERGQTTQLRIQLRQLRARLEDARAGV